MFRFVLFCFMCSAFASKTFAQQNLVPNPSFEEYDTYPQFMANLFAVGWMSANGASPDYFNTCSLGEVGVPLNIFGYQNPRSGNAYAGFYSNYPDTPSLNYREYIQCKLVKPLTQNRTYQVKFYVTLSDVSGFGCNNLGALFTENPIYDNWVEHFNLNPNITNYNNLPIIDKVNWIEVAGEYIANGNENYLTIGVYLDRYYTSNIPLNDGMVDAPYYFIDDVSVTENFDKGFVMPTAFTPNSDGANDTFYPVILDSTAIVKEFRIYNAWGALIHNNTEPWDGTYLGKLQPPGVYAYYVVVDSGVKDNMSQTTSYPKSGSFTLIR